MKIISKFKDYYDMCEYMGIDPKCVYIRHTEQIFKNGLSFDQNRILSEVFNRGWYDDLPCIQRERYRYSDYRPNEMTVEPHWVAFSGKAYLVYLKKHNTSEKTQESYSIPYEIMWDFDEIYSILKKKYDELSSNNFWISKYGSITKDKLDRLSENMIRTIPNEFFIEFNSPVISSFGPDYFYGDYVKNYSLEVDRIFINPPLLSLGFQNVMYPQTAWQELSMFLMGVLRVGDPNMIEVDDKYKIMAHGYDKHSFRNTHHLNKPRGNKK